MSPLAAFLGIKHKRDHIFAQATRIEVEFIEIFLDEWKLSTTRRVLDIFVEFSEYLSLGIFRLK